MIILCFHFLTCQNVNYLFALNFLKSILKSLNIEVWISSDRKDYVYIIFFELQNLQFFKNSHFSHNGFTLKILKLEKVVNIKNVIIMITLIKTRMIPSWNYPNSTCYHYTCIFCSVVFLLSIYFFKNFKKIKNNIDDLLIKTHNKKKIVIHNHDCIDKNKDDIILKLSKFNVLSLYLHFLFCRFSNIFIYFFKNFKKIKNNIDDLLIKTHNKKKIVIHNHDCIDKNKDDIILKLSKFNVLSLYLHFLFCRFSIIYIFF